MTVRELVTKITFALNKSSVSQANAATDTTKKKMDDVGIAAERAAVHTTASMNRIGQAANRTSVSVSRIGQAFNLSSANASTGMNRLGRTIYFVINRLSSLGSAIIRMRSALSSLNLSGVAAKFRNFGSAASEAIGKVNRATDSLTGHMAALGGAMAAAFSVSKIKDTADEMMNLDNKMRVLFNNENERLATKEKIYELSQKDRIEYAAMGDLVYKVARAGKQFGISMQDSLRISDIVSKGLNLGGAGTQESKAAILQLGQALSSGRLQGDELRSLDENASQLMTHVAEKFGVTTGQLKDMGAQGLLTTEALTKAILASGADIDAEFSTHVPTIGQAITTVGNVWSRTIDKIQEKTGLFGDIAAFIIDQASYVESETNAMMDLAKGPGDTEESQSKYAELQQQHENLVLILDVWNGISGVINDIEEFLGTDNMGAKIAIAAVAAGALLTVLGIIGGVLSGVSALWGILTVAFEAGMGIIAALSWPVVLAIAAIAAAIYFVQEHWDECVALFQPGLDAMMNGIELLKGAWYNIQPAIKALEPLLSMIANFIGGVIVFAVLNLWNTATAAFNAIAYVINGVAYALSIVAGWVDSLIEKLKTFLGMQNQVNGSVTSSWVSSWHNSSNQTQNNTYNFGSAGENVLGVYQSNNSFFDAGG